MKRCPHCAGYGIYRSRRALWRRLFRRPHTYSCIDCGTTFTRRTLEAARPVTQAETAEALREMRLPKVTGPRHFAHLAHRGGRFFEQLVRDACGLVGRGSRTLKGLLQGAGVTPIRVWVIKQIDADLLHLCGIGTLYHPRQRPWVALSALRHHRYQGGVRLGKTGIVLNSRLFADLVPLEALTLRGPTLARWEGRDWRVSQVPRRSWEHEGRLVVDRDTDGEGERLTSGEDVSRIRDNIDPQAAEPGIAVFQPGAGRAGSYRARGPMRRRDS